MPHACVIDQLTQRIPQKSAAKRRLQNAVGSFTALVHAGACFSRDHDYALIIGVHQ